ncbi:MAG: CPBP family intramembrane metalloprotease [Elusimicrobia bacterium]|nr:CPBP family intramembrane metalloprotease [Elusimicrobiota bacterium]
MTSVRSWKVPAESISGLRRGVVFLLPLSALIALETQAVNPLAERVYPYLYNVLADRGLDLDLAWFYSYLTVGVFSTLALGVLAVIGLRLYQLEPGAIGWKRPRTWSVRLLAGAVAGGLYVPVWGIARNLPAVVFFQRLPHFSIGPAAEWGRLTTAPAFNVLLGTWTYGAVFEEIFYRGLVYAVLKKRFSRRVALPLSALVFATAHFSWLGGRPFNLFEFGGLVCLGIVCAGLLEWDGTLLAPIAAHLTSNLFAFALPVAFKMF